MVRAGMQSGLYCKECHILLSNIACAYEPRHCGKYQPSKSADKHGWRPSCVYCYHSINIKDDEFSRIITKYNP